MKKAIGGTGFLIAGSKLFSYIMSNVNLYELGKKDGLAAFLLDYGPIPPVIFGVSIVMMIVGSVLIISGIEKD